VVEDTKLLRNWRPLLPYGPSDESLAPLPPAVREGSEVGKKLASLNRSRADSPAALPLPVQEGSEVGKNWPTSIDPVPILPRLCRSLAGRLRRCEEIGERHGFSDDLPAPMVSAVRQGSEGVKKLANAIDSATIFLHLRCPQCGKALPSRVDPSPLLAAAPLPGYGHRLLQSLQRPFYLSAFSQDSGTDLTLTSYPLIQTASRSVNVNIGRRICRV
jgi:hypothetical protein